MWVAHKTVDLWPTYTQDTFCVYLLSICDIAHMILPSRPSSVTACSIRNQRGDKAIGVCSKENIRLVFCCLDIVIIVHSLLLCCVLNLTYIMYNMYMWFLTCMHGVCMSASLFSCCRYTIHVCFLILALQSLFCFAWLWIQISVRISSKWISPSKI